MTVPFNAGFDSPRPSVAEVQRLAAMGLSVRARVGYVSLLMVSVFVATAVGSLWATEPALPLRTRAALGVITLMAVGWSVLAAWVLRTRRVLFGRDRVVAARLALAFSTVAALGMAALGYRGPRGNAMYYAALVNAAFAVVAWVLLRQASRHVARLTEQRRNAEARMSGVGLR
jgi:hypothetical protein